MQRKKKKKRSVSVNAFSTYLHDKSRNSPKHFLAESYTMVRETKNNQDHCLGGNIHGQRDRQTDRQTGSYRYIYVSRKTVQSSQLSHTVGVRKGGLIYSNGAY